MPRPLSAAVARLLSVATTVLEDLAGYVASCALRPVVSSVFPLADVAAAHEAFGRGGILGKHVIAVAA